MPNDADFLDLLLDWAPDAADRQRILVDNPRRTVRLSSRMTISEILQS